MTVLLVAAALVFIIAMAALAIDLGTLYVVRSDMQRAADAAALGGARAFADSGVTSGAAALSDAQALAAQYAQLVVASSPIGGRLLDPASEVAISFPDNGVALATNPHIRVVLQRADLPVFFARVWGTRFATVSATANAEAYNPSGNTMPVASSIKLWAMPNCDPTHTGSDPAVCQGFAQFVDPNSGVVVNPDVVGKTINLQERLVGDVEGPGVYFNLVPSFDPDVSVCPALNNAPTCAPPQGYATYYDGIQCTTNQTVRCRQPIYAAPQHRISDMQGAASCMIHANTLGARQGQDLFNLVPGATPPVAITAGYNNLNSAVRGTQIASSDSVITVPLFEPGNPVVSGFLQLGVTQICPANSPDCGSLPQSGPQVIVLNVAGCNGTTGGYPVTGSGASPVAVRLIANSTPTPQ